MADRLDHSNNTKCSGSRKGPKLRIWIWCIIVQCFLNIPCILSDCLGVDIAVEVYPKGYIQIEHGQPLQVFCIAKNNYSSNDIDFTFAGDVIESEIVNSTTKLLYIEKPEKQLKTYYCQNNKNGRICVVRVLVDTPPENVTDFNCMSKNMDILNCSWTSPNMYSNVNYSLTFSINGNIVSPSCIADRVDNTLIRYCVWNTTSQPRYRQNEEEQFFYMKSCNVFGCNHQNFTINHYSIVRPDPPSGLRVVRNGTHSVGLKWEIPNNMVDFLSCGVDHIIEYQIAKIDNTTYFRRVDASFLPPKNKTYKFNLTNLPYANVQYEVRVYIKSKKAIKREYWSNFSYTVFYTASERPRRPPDVIAGAFDHATINNKRVIFVYWKQLEEYEQAGANFTYKVLTTQGNRTQIVFPDKNKSLSYVILNVTLDALDVTVWSFNNNGSSLNSSHIYIPPEKETSSLKLRSFTKLAYENGTYELSWVGIKNIDNYTLFWCQHNSTKVCSGRLDFAVLDPKKTNHIINLPNQYRYQFAIAANNGSKTSGMVWARCEISKDGFILYVFPVRLNYDAPGKSHVNLSWVFECTLKEGLVIGYNISYCPIVRTSTNCDKSVESKHVFISNPKQMEVTINDLLPFRTYQFNFALKTIDGPKNIDNATIVITTLEDAPTNPRNVVISNITSDSLVISWDPPLQRNGIIGKYVIYRNNTEFYVDKVSGTDTTRRSVTLRGLQGFTNYSFAVQACNIAIDLCSKVSPNDYIFIRTRIGPPSRIKAPLVKNSPDIIKWEVPEFPGGTLDRYQVRRIKDDMEPELFNTTQLSYSVVHCEGGISSETYQVRAINFDEDYYHGVLFENNVEPPSRGNINMYEFPSEWSEPSIVACKSRDGVTMIFIFVGVFSLVGLIYGSIKFYKRYRKMEDIKPVLPNGLGIPEKDISKYTFGGWNPNSKEEKPSSDEMLLLPNNKSSATLSDTKQKDFNGDASDQTDSTTLSDASKGTIDKQASTSDDGSNSSLNLEEPIKCKDKKGDDDQEEEVSSGDDTESSCENTSYLSNETLKKNPSGYIQPTINTNTGYVSAQPVIKNVPPHAAAPPPASSSYVMAGLSSPAYSTALPPMPNIISPSSGYVLRDDPQSKLGLGFTKQNPSKTFEPEHLPSSPSLPPSAKISADSSYMQLQSLDSLPSFKPAIRNTVPLKPAASGYVSPADVVINKHLNNMLTAGQHPQQTEESAILDPSMSPDAYCRFSWSTDPANDNLHSLLADTPTQPAKN